MLTMTLCRELYEELCANLKVPVDSKIMRALQDVRHAGELNIGGFSVTGQSCDILSKVLTQSKDIGKLIVSDCLLPPQGLAILLSVIHLTNVQTLQLRGNNIGGPSVYKVSKMISRSNLKKLGLEWNNLGLCAEGMTQFCNALAGSRSLEVLDLRNNQLDENCAALLAGALRKNTTLRALDVRWNSMEQAGGQYFLAALQTNKTLTALKLQGNSISNDLLTAIEQCVQHNSQLLKLESGYEARKEVLANHVKAVTSQRAQELRQWADKSQRQVNEMDAKVKEVQELLSTKHQQLEKKERVLLERSEQLEMVQSQLRGLQEELRLRENSHAAVVRDYTLQLDILNKALAANKNALSTLESKLEEERLLRESVERERTKDIEKVRHLEMEINRGKEELQMTITEHIGAVEQERKQFQQRLALVAEEWGGRLEQQAAEHSRAEAVWKDRLRALEVALDTAERSRTDLNTQLLAEKSKWAEEKANIWVEAKEKEAVKVLLLTEKVEHLKEEKNSLETQLSAANMTTQQLQRDNSSFVADLADLRRKLSAVQEELSGERLLVQKLRSEKADDARVLESGRSELTNAKRIISEANLREEDLRRELRKLGDKLEDKDRHISTIRKEEKDRASILVAAIKSYVEQVNTTNP